jgi:hypothetical protein
MTKVDEVRAGLFKSEGEFVEKLKNADKASAEVRAEALVRVNALFKYASLKGRGRFLDEMKLEGATKKRKIAFDMCEKGGKPKAECDALMEEIALFRPLVDAWPTDNTGPAWWSAPLTHLIGTYDPNSPPAGQLGSWRDNLDPLAKGAAVADDVADAVGDVVGEAIDDIADIGGSVDDAIDEQRKTVAWLKVGAAVAGTAVTGALVYRIVRR